MPEQKRLVIDTNLLVSGFLFRGSVPRRAIIKAHDEGLLLASEATLAELVEVFQRPKFDRAARWSLLESLLREYASRCEMVHVDSTIHSCRDPRDNKFLELAVDGRANLILTGDVDLLALNPFRNIAIISPQQFLAED